MVELARAMPSLMVSKATTGISGPDRKSTRLNSSHVD